MVKRAPAGGREVIVYGVLAFIVIVGVLLAVFVDVVRGAAYALGGLLFMSIVAAVRWKYGTLAPQKGTPGVEEFTIALALLAVAFLVLIVGLVAIFMIDQTMVGIVLLVIGGFIACVGAHYLHLCSAVEAWLGRPAQRAPALQEPKTFGGIVGVLCVYLLLQPAVALIFLYAQGRLGWASALYALLFSSSYVVACILLVRKKPYAVPFATAVLWSSIIWIALTVTVRLFTQWSFISPAARLDALGPLQAVLWPALGLVYLRSSSRVKAIYGPLREEARGITPYALLGIVFSLLNPVTGILCAVLALRRVRAHPALRGTALAIAALAVALIVLAASVGMVGLKSYVAAKPVCVDDDGGVAPYVRGTVLFTDGTRGVDRCVKPTVVDDACTGKNCKVQEFHCLNEPATERYVEVECPVGCSDGACIGK